MKNVFKDLLFVLIFLILLYFCSNILVLKGNGYGSDVTSFYREKRNSLDVIFFGSSHSYATFSPYIIKEKTGYNSYNFATQQQPIYITYHYMVEALKKQQPKYFVLEARMLSVDDEYTTEGVVRDAIDKMHFSLNKIKAINISVQNKKDRLAYYFNIIKYHSRYSSLSLSDIVYGIKMTGINNKGFKKLNKNEKIILDNSEVLKTDAEIQISEKNLKYLNKIFDLCKENNIELIVVKSPNKLEKSEYAKYNWLNSYCTEKNIQFINYNEMIGELNIQRGDFYDYGHLSYSGAEKVSNNFADFLNSLK